MSVITTKVVVTNNGCHVVAKCDGGRVKVPYKGKAHREDHVRALRALVAKLEWGELDQWVGAHQGPGMVWVPVRDAVRISAPHGVAVMNNDLGFKLPKGWVEVQRDDALAVFESDEAAAKACSPEARLYPEVAPTPHGRQPWNAQVWIVPAASVGGVAS